jgi:hypothetical protein
VSKHAGKEFKVRIDIHLPEEVFDRIEGAIQKAVLNELAETDVADGYSVLMRAPADRVAAEAATADAPRRGGGGPEGADVRDPFGGLGSTDGIWIRDERSILI